MLNVNGLNFDWVTIEFENTSQSNPQATHANFTSYNKYLLKILAQIFPRSILTRSAEEQFDSPTGVSAHSTVDDDLLFSREPEAVKLPFDAEFALLLLLDGLHDDIGLTKKKELCGEGMLAADPFASDRVAEVLAPKFKACNRFNSS
uniref:Uncharacterized protein n=1 Tax=Glossina austeni TaxID=7395 RepID=A0A1A9UG02_GLOAU